LLFFAATANSFRPQSDPHYTFEENDVNQAYIVDAIRVAGGKRGGILSQTHPAILAAHILDALVTRSGIDPAIVDDVIMGCVTQVGEQSVNIARSAILSSGLPDHVPGVTIDRQCGSSQQAIHFAVQAVQSGAQDVVIAAGVESMSRVPIAAAMTLAASAGLGNGPFTDGMRARFGVEDFNQFTGAQMLARQYGINRDDMDRYALESHRRAARARDAGAFTEIVPITVDGPAGQVEHMWDEGIRTDSTLEGIGSLRTLTPDGTITAGNASQICDGAAGVLVMSEAAVRANNVVPIARVEAMAVTAGDPVVMVAEPIGATHKLLERAGISMDAVDLVELNEAFAAVPLAWIKAFDVDPAKVNLRGGAIALGHPLGASGAKLAATFLAIMAQTGAKRGLQLMCEGGGMANATLYERL
jgi:acetyl-CoA C-acetyltransferase